MLDRDRIRANLNKYTRKAFEILPKLENPSILDIGCGTGVPTIELAKLSRGEIVAIDISRESLNRLERNAEREGLAHKIDTVYLSASELEELNRHFDIVWAEGVIAAIGFEKGLREWRSLVKPGGFLVIHDDYTDTESKLDLIPQCGYRLLDRFILSWETWWTEHYRPLEEELNGLESGGPDDSLKSEIAAARSEIEKFRTEYGSNSSIFFIMQRVDSI